MIKMSQPTEIIWKMFQKKSVEVQAYSIKFRNYMTKNKILYRKKEEIY